MADVYGRLTGRAGVCLATLGPGATNLVTGVADGNMDRAPLVAIAGQGATTRMHKESHQVLDLVNLFDPITKYSVQIREPEIVPEIVRKAFKFAQKKFFAKNKKNKSRRMSQFYHHYFDKVATAMGIPLINFYHPDKKTRPGYRCGQKSFNSTYIRLLLRSP